MSRTSEQERVIEWLRDELGLPVFAGAYEGALDCLDAKSAGYITFVAHAGRDLMNLLARTVGGIESGRVQYQQHVEKLRKSWRDEWREQNITATAIEDEGHVIPFKVCGEVFDLIDEDKAGSLRNSDADTLFFNAFLEYQEKDRIPANFMTDWKNARKWFLSHAHLRKKNFTVDTVATLNRHFSTLHSFLYVAASTQYERLQSLNEILEDTNE